MDIVYLVSYCVFGSQQLQAFVVEKSETIWTISDHDFSDFQLSRGVELLH